MYRQKQDLTKLPSGLTTQYHSETIILDLVKDNPILVYTDKVIDFAYFRVTCQITMLAIPAATSDQYGEKTTDAPGIMGDPLRFFTP